MRSTSIVFGAALALVVIGACAGTPAATSRTTPAGGAATPAGGAATPAGGAATPAGGGEAVSTSIIDFDFVPAQVTLAQGGTVTWVNDGQQPHTVEWDDGEPESPTLNNGDDYERTFDTAGTYDYVCGIHSDMEGSVTVTE